MKILIVDFDGNNFNTLNTNLEEKDFTVIQVNDGLNALEKFQKENPDLVILHSDLPQVHAFYFCRKVREEYKKDTPIIIISDNSSKSVRKEAADRFNITHYFVKPCDEKNVLSTVLSFFDEKNNVEFSDKSEEETPKEEDLFEFTDESDELRKTDIIEILNGSEKKYSSEELFGDIIKKCSSKI